jgi:hypothetical protein
MLSSDVRAAQVSSELGCASALAGIKPLCISVYAAIKAAASVSPIPDMTPFKRHISFFSFHATGG